MAFVLIMESQMLKNRPIVSAFYKEGIGRRTGAVLKNEVRKDSDGFEIFDDYFSESEADNTELSFAVNKENISVNNARIGGRGKNKPLSNAKKKSFPLRPMKSFSPVVSSETSLQYTTSAQDQTGDGSNDESDLSDTADQDGAGPGSDVRKSSVIGPEGEGKKVSASKNNSSGEETSASEGGRKSVQLSNGTSRIGNGVVRSEDDDTEQPDEASSGENNGMVLEQSHKQVEDSDKEIASEDATPLVSKEFRRGPVSMSEKQKREWKNGGRESKEMKTTKFTVGGLKSNVNGMEDKEDLAAGELGSGTDGEALAEDVDLLTNKDINRTWVTVSEKERKAPKKRSNRSAMRTDGETFTVDDLVAGENIKRATVTLTEEERRTSKNRSKMSTESVVGGDVNDLEQKDFNDEEHENEIDGEIVTEHDHHSTNKDIRRTRQTVSEKEKSISKKRSKRSTVSEERSDDMEEEEDLNDEEQVNGTDGETLTEDDHRSTNKAIRGRRCTVSEEESRASKNRHKRSTGSGVGSSDMEEEEDLNDEEQVNGTDGETLTDDHHSSYKDTRKRTVTVSEEENRVPRNRTNRSTVSGVGSNDMEEEDLNDEEQVNGTDGETLTEGDHHSTNKVIRRARQTVSEEEKRVSRNRSKRSTVSGVGSNDMEKEELHDEEQVNDGTDGEALTNDDHHSANKDIRRRTATVSEEENRVPRNRSKRSAVTGEGSNDIEEEEDLNDEEQVNGTHGETLNEGDHHSTNISIRRRTVTDSKEEKRVPQNRSTRSMASDVTSDKDLEKNHPSDEEQVVDIDEGTVATDDDRSTEKSIERTRVTVTEKESRASKKRSKKSTVSGVGGDVNDTEKVLNDEEQENRTVGATVIEDDKHSTNKDVRRSRVTVSEKEKLESKNKAKRSAVIGVRSNNMEGKLLNAEQVDDIDGEVVAGSSAQEAERTEDENQTTDETEHVRDDSDGQSFDTLAKQTVLEDAVVTTKDNTKQVATGSGLSQERNGEMMSESTREELMSHRKEEKVITRKGGKSLQSLLHESVITESPQAAQIFTLTKKRLSFSAATEMRLENSHDSIPRGMHPSKKKVSEDQAGTSFLSLGKRSSGAVFSFRFSELLSSTALPDENQSIAAGDSDIVIVSESSKAGFMKKKSTAKKNKKPKVSGKEPADLRRSVLEETMLRGSKALLKKGLGTDDGCMKVTNHKKQKNHQIEIEKTFEVANEDANEVVISQELTRSHVGKDDRRNKSKSKSHENDGSDYSLQKGEDDESDSEASLQEGEVEAGKGKKPSMLNKTATAKKVHRNRSRSGEENDLNGSQEDVDVEASNRTETSKRKKKPNNLKMTAAENSSGDENQQKSLVIQEGLEHESGQPGRKNRQTKALIGKLSLKNNQQESDCAESEGSKGEDKDRLQGKRRKSQGDALKSKRGHNTTIIGSDTQQGEKRRRKSEGDALKSGIGGKKTGDDSDTSEKGGQEASDAVATRRSKRVQSKGRDDHGSIDAGEKHMDGRNREESQHNMTSVLDSKTVPTIKSTARKSRTTKERKKTKSSSQSEDETEGKTRQSLGSESKNFAAEVEESEEVEDKPVAGDHQVNVEDYLDEDGDEMVFDAEVDVGDVFEPASGEESGPQKTRTIPNSRKRKSDDTSVDISTNSKKSRSVKNTGSDSSSENNEGRKFRGKKRKGGKKKKTSSVELDSQDEVHINDGRVNSMADPLLKSGRVTRTSARRAASKTKSTSSEGEMDQHQVGSSEEVAKTNEMEAKSKGTGSRTGKTKPASSGSEMENSGVDLMTTAGKRTTRNLRKRRSSASNQDSDQNLAVAVKTKKTSQLDKSSSKITTINKSNPLEMQEDSQEETEVEITAEEALKNLNKVDRACKLSMVEEEEQESVDVTIIDLAASRRSSIKPNVRLSTSLCSTKGKVKRGDRSKAERINTVKKTLDYEGGDDFHQEDHLEANLEEGEAVNEISDSNLVADSDRAIDSGTDTETSNVEIVPTTDEDGVNAGACSMVVIPSDTDIDSSKARSSGVNGAVNEDGSSPTNVQLGGEISEGLATPTASTETDEPQQAGRSTPMSILKSSKAFKRHRRSKKNKYKKFRFSLFDPPKPKAWIIPPDDDSQSVRRSRRNRVRPLEWWRNELPVYEKRKSGGFALKGIDSPEYDQQPYARKKSGKGNKGRRVRSVPITPKNLSSHCPPPDDSEAGSSEPVVVVNPETQREVLIDIMRTPDTFRYVGPSGDSPTERDNFIVTKTLLQPAFNTGSLILRPEAEKGLQLLQYDTMVFYVVRGKLAVTIHKSTRIIESGAYFFVPHGNVYNIINLRKDEAKLIFFQHKGAPVE